MRIVITGANGQLGKALTKQLAKNHDVYAFPRNELDVTNSKQLHESLLEVFPDVIIHAGAYTAVDEAERSPTQAFAINSIGTYNVAICAAKLNAKVIYISTDYVFDGMKSEPYDIHDMTNPLNIYGKSKLYGEEFVMSIVKDASIVRTSWLYGHGGANFVNTMIERARNNQTVTVVDDQIGSPTYTKDLAKAINELIYNKKGIYHISNSGNCSWYSFAKEIYRLIGANPTHVQPVTTKVYGALAKRPQYTVLSHHSLKENGIPILRNWDLALKEYLSEINGSG